MTALAFPALLGAAGLVVDVGIWYRESARLQMAADAAALGAGYLLGNSQWQQESASQQLAALQGAALTEAQDATQGQLIGTLATPVAVALASNHASLTVTLTSAADVFFAQAVGIARPKLQASATAAIRPAAPCVLALDPAATDAISVNNMGSIVATNCGVFADSAATDAVYLNSGTIEGSTIGAVGTVGESNSGSNTMSPAGTSGDAVMPDPEAGRGPPLAPSCAGANTTYTYTAWQSAPYQFDTNNEDGVWCNHTVTIGGNGTTDQFAPGVYYIVNGNLVLNNANVTLASGVTFVLTGTSPGAFEWTNYSNTLTFSPPSSGPTAGILVWQECSQSGSEPANTFGGGSTLNSSGLIYAPCGSVQLSNNIHLSSSGVIADTISVVGSATLAAASTTSGAPAISRPTLTQ